MATPSRGVFGNPPPQIGQNRFALLKHSSKYTCGIGGYLKKIDTQPI
jgi:hypothetical protein